MAESESHVRYLNAFYLFVAQHFRPGITALLPLTLSCQAFLRKVHTCGRRDECIGRGAQQHRHHTNRRRHRGSHRDRITKRRNFLHVAVDGVRATELVDRAPSFSKKRIYFRW